LTYVVAVDARDAIGRAVRITYEDRLDRLVFSLPTATPTGMFLIDVALSDGQRIRLKIGVQ
jgi:hypothetical protein